MASRDDMELTLTADQLINNKWKVISQLGKGGFGAVYRVVSATDPKKEKVELAMKIESVVETAREESMIMMEVAVLKMFRNQAAKARNVCAYYDSGETTIVRYVVMELLGPSLSDLRKRRPEMKFTESTTIRLGLQCLDGIESMHRIGFLHRDIKPANFAIGRGPKNRVVFILDFGLSRQYITRDGELREPRKKAGFRGTVRYCSLNAHYRHELGRHDDLWSLIYVMIEFQRGELPWSKIHDKDEVFKLKKAMVADELLKGMAKEFHKIVNELHGLQYGDTPNYASVDFQFKAVLKRMKYREDDPFDWQIQQ